MPARPHRIPAAAGGRRVRWPTTATIRGLTMQPPSRTRFYRDKRNGKVFGVCAGIADYTGFDVNLVRVCMVAAVFLSSGSILPFYFIAAFITPDKPRALAVADHEEKQFWQGVRASPTRTARDIRCAVQGHRPPARRHRELRDHRKPLAGARDRPASLIHDRRGVRNHGRPTAVMLALIIIGLPVIIADAVHRQRASSAFASASSKLMPRWRRKRPRNMPRARPSWKRGCACSSRSSPMAAPRRLPQIRGVAENRPAFRGTRNGRARDAAA